MKERTMRRIYRKGMLLVLAVLTLVMLFTTTGVRPARAGCGLGDIICEGQQAIQQLIDTYVGPLQAWVTFQTNKAFYVVIYNIEKSVAAALWSLSKGFITVGVGVGVISKWVSSNFFQP